MPSESRRPYQALTLNWQATFSDPRSEARDLGPTVESAWSPLDSPQWRRWALFVRAREIVILNADLLLVVAAQAAFSVVNVAVKKLQSLEREPVSTLQLIVVRMAITYACSIGYMYVAYPPLENTPPTPYQASAKGTSSLLGPEGVRLLLVFRGVTGFIGLNGTYFALQYLSLSDVTVLSFLVPMTTALSASIFLGEAFSRKEALAGLCSLFGVVLIARPDFLFGPSTSSTPIEERNRMMAIGIALAGVVGSTGAMTTIRAIGHRAHPIHLLSFFSLQSVIAASILMVFQHEPVVIPTRPAWLGLLAVIGVLGFLAQVLLTMGYQRETAGRAGMALYTQIIFASVLERVFFGTSPTFLSMLGTSIIMSSAIFVALSVPKHIAEKSDPAMSLEEGHALLAKDPSASFESIRSTLDTEAISPS
ncbi:unnamed protein product [Mycena citricolor]|uniref:EamA domain-containing protein n=1 Tax=Mycena citricolor TaxID=2018698 RepID=A0AAD2K4C7_9AGAR|nr:unnamed protein product [Mycena citricolor]